MNTMKDFKKELALLLETYDMCIAARTVEYDKGKHTSMIVFQSFDAEVVENNTRRSHLCAEDLDHTLNKVPLGKKVEGLV